MALGSLAYSPFHVRDKAMVLLVQTATFLINRNAHAGVRDLGYLEDWFCAQSTMCFTTSSPFWSV